MAFSRRVVIKVHGGHYETFESTLRRYPLTRLGSQAQHNELQPAGNKSTIILDCDASVFDGILFYYQSFGILRCPVDVKMDDFVAECRNLEIDEHDIKKMQEREGFLYHEPVTLDNSTNTIRKIIWRFLESPESSTPASIYAIFSCLLIAASTCLTCVQTLPSIRNSEVLSLAANPLLALELFLNLFFGTEYLLRIISSPDKGKFIRSVPNVIDFFTVYPYFVVLIIDIKNVSSFKFIRVIRSVRILRLMRLTKHSKSMETAIRIMGNCLSDLVTMVSIIFISCLISATLEYSAESNVKGTKFTSIPMSLWWAAQTVIPVGYGDIVPQSTVGKIVGGVVVVMSSLTFALPLLFLGGRFLKYYSTSFGLTIQCDFKAKSQEKRQYKP